MADTVSYEESTLENKFAIPAERNPAIISYAVSLDNYEPVRTVECGCLVTYDGLNEISGHKLIMLSDQRTDMVTANAVFIVDDGRQAVPYWCGAAHSGNPAPLYPEGCEPHVILFPFPVNPRQVARLDGRIVDYSDWMLGPRKVYHLKINRWS